MKFLEYIADEVITLCAPCELEKLCIVFPSRRAGIYFKKYLSSKLENPVWSPAVLGIEDFVRRFSPYIIADSVTLVFELYSVYSKLADESFDDFYPWGEMLLRDFDAVDKYLADPALLFKTIKDLKEIDEAFPAELHEEFREFWGAILEGADPDGVKDSFVKIWEIMGQVYTDFKAALSAKGIAYEGMAFRKLYEDVQASSLERRTFFNYTKIIFAGFNSLNKCEEEIIKTLVQSGKAEVYWDADEYYYGNKSFEAGKFIRSNIKKIGGINTTKSSPFENNLAGAEKNISVYGTPLNLGIAKALGDRLNLAIKEGTFTPENSVVVLPDENLLLPVLYSLPEGINQLNITMGFPFRATPLYNFILLLKKLQSGKRLFGTALKFYHKDVIRILLHPYAKFQSPSLFFDAVREIKKRNITYIDIHGLFKEVNKRRTFSNAAIPEIINLVFSAVDRTEDIHVYLQHIVYSISDRIQKSSSGDSEELISGVNNYKVFQLEYIYNFLSKLNLLNDVIVRHGARENFLMSSVIFWRVLIRVLNSVRISFTGEPLKGFQVMGLLETRCLDFENVFILSMNEGALPKGSTYNSFIPYSLRKTFGMPTFEDDDAAQAYYFYRLLQRAKTVSLFYNTEIGEDSKEKSRFILQLEHELAKTAPAVSYSHKILSPKLLSSSVKEISVEKSGDVLESLNKITTLSTSELSAYINCSLQFYLKKLAGLGEEDEVEEIFSSTAFGSLLHGVMQNLFTAYISKTVTAEDIEVMTARVENDYDVLFAEVLEKEISIRSMEFGVIGRNALYRTVIQKLAVKVLKHELKDAPFNILGLEEKFEYDRNIAVNGAEHKLILKGRLDRRDEKNGIIRIIDYKSGASKMKTWNKKEFGQYLEEIFTKPEKTHSFQTFFYAYLYGRLYAGEKVNAGILSMRELGKGVQPLKNTGPLDADDINAFESRLDILISEIFNPAVPFTKTDNPGHCEYCPFINLCCR